MTTTPTTSVRAAPEHHGLIREIARAIRERPDLVDKFRDMLDGKMPAAAVPVTVLSGLRDALDDLAETDAPKPGEFPKMVCGRICADRREERKSRALGPAPEAEAPASDWEKCAANLEKQQRADAQARNDQELARWKFTHG